MNEFNKIIERELAEGLNMSIVNLIDQLIKHAFVVHASDIHIDPLEKNIRVRFRIDGVLEDSILSPKKSIPKYFPHQNTFRLHTDEHYAAQDGRFRSMVKNLET